MKFVNLILTVVILAALSLFIIQNWAPTELSFWTFEKELPLSIIGICFYIVGGISGGLIASIFRKSLKSRKEY